MLSAFTKIDYDEFLDYLEEAQADGTRIRMSDAERFKNFIFENWISDAIVKSAIKELGPDVKITVFEKGRGKGLYLYSWNTDNPHENYAYRYKLMPGK